MQLKHPSLFLFLASLRSCCAGTAVAAPAQQEQLDQSRAQAECGTVVWSDEIDVAPEHLYESSWLCHRTRSESVKMKSAAQMQAQAESCAMPNGSWKKNMPRSSAIVGLRYWKKPRTFSGKRFAP